MRNTPLLFYSGHDFPRIFHRFTRSFVEHEIATQKDDTSSIYDFYNNFVKSSAFDPINFEIPKIKIDGYIFFTSQKIIIQERCLIY